MADVTVKKDGPNNLQNDGGIAQSLRQFEVKDTPVTNQPGSKSSWNSNMGNPVGPK